MRRLGIFGLAATLLVGSFWAGYAFRGSPEVTARQIRDTSAKFKFISPLIGVSLGPKELFPQYEPLHEVFSEKIAQAKKDGRIVAASVYFRDVNSGMWTGVGENDLYAPSSMLKVVVMLAYLDHAEDDPSALSKLLPYQPTMDGEFFHSGAVLPAGNYSAQKLLERMILYSDNDALTPLFNEVQDKVVEVNNALRLPLPATSDGTQDFMSPRAYSLVFRTLYNSTYLSREVSEKALELLSHTTFMQGIVAGVPQGTTVSHKFGERTDIVGGVVVGRELHDCGLVYALDEPYFLCIMTKGRDFNSLASFIADISATAYDSVADSGENKR